MKVKEYAGSGREVSIYDTHGKYTMCIYSGTADEIPEELSEEFAEEADEFADGVDLFI